MDSSFIASIKNCEGCAKRKEAVNNMLSSHNFWIGFAVGVGATYAWHMYKAKKA